MPLSPGDRLGPYEILAKLGAGGMGEVFRARDARLGRDVAIKVLPDLDGLDPDRRLRFEREAKTLAALNHPHIAHVYGVEDGALVMELVDGQDLTAVIARGPMALSDVLRIARQIAEALEAAHEQGIVHRDLKPANVKVRSDGTVKVIDFGLAKPLEPLVAGHASESTRLTPHTERGVVLGTAAYMAPEQARGRLVDKRADIWAFGVVLYEMLTGERPFKGDSFADTVSAVLRSDVDLARLPAEAPRPLRQLVARCLQPDAKERLRDIGEARITLTALERGDNGVIADAPAVTRLRPHASLAWAITAAAVVLAAAAVASARFGWFRSATPDSSPALARLSVLPPPGLDINPDSPNMALSPDGRLIAFVVGTGVSSENQLWVRSLESATPRQIESAAGAAMPFWSPDSTRIGFFADRKLKTVPATGGSADVLCDAPFARGGAWNTSNIIVFAPDASGPIYRVSSAGGAATPVTTLDAARHETGHRFPSFLPDGDHFLYAALPGAESLPDVFAGSLSNANLKTRIGAMESSPVFAPPGFLLFTRQSVLVAQPFDDAALRTTGDVVALGDEPGTAPGPQAYGAGRRVSVSAAGTLAFVSANLANTSVEWRDVLGRATGRVDVRPGRYSTVAISPDGTRAVLQRLEAAGSASVWLINLTHPGGVPVVDGLPARTRAIWSPDGLAIAFTSTRDGAVQLFRKAVADPSPAQAIRRVGDSGIPASWFRDDILFNQIDPGLKWDIYRVPSGGRGDPIPVVHGPSIEVGGVVSPDGRWLAYRSDETGSLDLFVQAYAEAGSRQQVSTGGAQQAWWARDSRHLLFLKRDYTLWQTGVEPGPAGSIQVGASEQLASFPTTLIDLDLDPTSQRFLTLVPEQASVSSITIEQGWRAAIGGRRN